MKEDIREKYCCITHAVSQNILNLDPKNLCRNINKLTLNAFFEQIGLKQGDPHVDPMFYSDNNDSKIKLNAIMPILNSV